MLVEFLREQPLIGVIGPLIKEGERWYAGGRNIGWYSETKIRYNPERTSNDFIDTDYVPGTVFLARREVFERAGFLDEEFFSAERLQISAGDYRAPGSGAAYTGEGIPTLTLIYGNPCIIIIISGTGSCLYATIMLIPGQFFD